MRLKPKYSIFIAGVLIGCYASKRIRDEIIEYLKEEGINDAKPVKLEPFKEPPLKTPLASAKI